MTDRLPLSALLSQVLVAFTIEFDNEFERQMPHRTTRSKPAAPKRGAVWLVSLVMYENFMRFVNEDGISVAELQRLTRHSKKSIQQWLDRMEKWWGYIVVDRANNMVRPSAAGAQAQRVWRGLFEVLEKRWETRFGRLEITHLRQSLWALVSRLNPDLPDYLPIVGYGLFTTVNSCDAPPPAPGSPLTALLSKVLLAFALEFESDWGLSLALSANVLRVLTVEGVRIRDLPDLTGVSKEAVKMSLGLLEEHSYIVVESRLAGLTPVGVIAQEASQQRVRLIEQGWQTRFGVDQIRQLQESLERLVNEPLARCLEPYPDGWRASVPRPGTLPHYPMVLHRGGFPDGA